MLRSVSAIAVSGDCAQNCQAIHQRFSAPHKAQPLVSAGGFGRDSRREPKSLADQTPSTQSTSVPLNGSSFIVPNTGTPC